MPTSSFWCFFMDFDTSSLFTSESCIKIKINLHFDLHTSLWCLKRFYEGLKDLRKTFLGTTKNCEIKNSKLIFFVWDREGIFSLLICCFYCWLGTCICCLLICSLELLCDSSSRLNDVKTSGFLMFSGGVEKEHWAEIG